MGARLLASLFCSQAWVSSELLAPKVFVLGHCDMEKPLLMSHQESPAGAVACNTSRLNPVTRGLMNYIPTLQENHQMYWRFYSVGYGHREVKYSYIPCYAYWMGSSGIVTCRTDCYRPGVTGVVGSPPRSPGVGMNRLMVCLWR